MCSLLEIPTLKGNIFCSIWCLVNLLDLLDLFGLFGRNGDASDSSLLDNSLGFFIEKW